MSYADQKMSGNKIVAIIIVALIHVLLGYALVTGLAYSAVQKAIEKVTTVEIKEPEKPKEPPPPPPKEKAVAPPIVAPPVRIDVAPPVSNPVITVPVAPPPQPIVLAPAAPAPAPPAPGPSKARGATAKNQSSWAARIQDNYPPRAMREEREGRVSVRVSIGADGRVTSCTVSGTSGSPDLDAAACDGMQRYGRYNPALDDAGNPTSGSTSTSIVYKLN